jgi:hypothetical protein
MALASCWKLSRSITMRFRFTIRDLLCLTLLVALAIGWWLKLPMAYALTWLIVLLILITIIFVLTSL